MVPGSCRPVLALERLLSHHGSLDTSRSVARLRHHGVEKIRPGLGSQVTRRSIALSSTHMHKTKMSPAEVTKRLKANEFTKKDLPKRPKCSVKSFDINTLESNQPVEDSTAQAILPNGAMLFGVFDGHGGAACGQVVARRIFEYIAAALLSSEKLSNHLKDINASVEKDDKTNPDPLVEDYNCKFEVVDELKKIYYKSYRDFLDTLSQKHMANENIFSEPNVEHILIDSFLRLDDDMSNEAMKDRKDNNIQTVTVAMSGCVAAVAYIDGIDLHVASTGDCTAVVGYLNETDTWMPQRLTIEHNSDNVNEVKRIKSEHPENEHHNLIQGGRLLSQLAPLRAFGDYKFKWDIPNIQKILGSIGWESACPPNYKTPPYLTARPEVQYHRLTPRDKFLVIASDGLWDILTPMQVVRLVGEHIKGKSVLEPFELNDDEEHKLQDILKQLKRRQIAEKVRPVDPNAATHLIRNALGNTAFGMDHQKISQSLSLPQNKVRMFRDDITIQVVFFNDDYLRKHR